MDPKAFAEFDKDELDKLVSAVEVEIIANPEITEILETRVNELTKHMKSLELELDSALFLMRETASVTTQSG